MYLRDIDGLARTTRAKLVDGVKEHAAGFIFERVLRNGSHVLPRAQFIKFWRLRLFRLTKRVKLVKLVNIVNTLALGIVVILDIAVIFLAGSWRHR